MQEGLMMGRYRDYISFNEKETGPVPSKLVANVVRAPAAAHGATIRANDSVVVDFAIAAVPPNVLTCKDSIRRNYPRGP
jgi:hypothetical protein